MKLVRACVQRTSSEHLWLAIPLILSFAMLCLAPLREGDLWWHLRVGEMIVRDRAIPSVDSFSFTASGQAYFFAHSWLSDLVLYLLASAGGLSALVLCQAVLETLVVGSLLLESLRRGAAAPLATIATLLGWLILYPFSTARPQIFSLLCFAACYSMLSAYRLSGHNRLCLLPPLVVAWCNLHGAWIMGLILLAAAVGLGVLEGLASGHSQRPLRPLIVWSLAALPATLVNPNGLEMYRHLSTVSSSQVNQTYVSEWLPPSLTNTLTWPFFASLALLLAALAYSRRRLPLYDFGLLFLFAALSVRYLRMLPFFAIVATPLLADLLSQLDLSLLWPRYEPYLGVPQVTRRGKPVLNTLIVLLLLLGALVAVPQFRLPLTGASELALVDPQLPLGAANYLAGEIRPGTRLFNMPEWGGLLIWRLGPRARVFVDGRIEIYPMELWDDYVRIIQTVEGWQELLQAYQVDYLVLSEERHGRLIQALAGSGWSCVYKDALALVFARQKD
ncbi:MAG: hypothetical protein JW850_07995 [Thermoflexales bacterium]|nr:hypothetical protein [Thermoflexales bacterium]